MVAYQRGDLSAFEQLYAALYPKMLRFMSQRDRNASADLAQEAFLEIHRARHTWRPPLPVEPWVFGVAANVLARHRRRVARRLRNEEPWPAQLEVAGEGLDVDVNDLHHAMASLQLPETTRQVWLLHHVGGMSFHAIARRLGITRVAAKLRASRASQRLRAWLGEGGHE
jgi:RNA polymerase sigma-70 factor, ECF subfamily